MLAPLIIKRAIGIPCAIASTFTDNSTTPSTTTNITTPSLEIYVCSFQNIFEIFKHIKELLQIAKLLKCIKETAEETKNCNNPIEKND